jgi:hypothetical protein
VFAHPARTWNSARRGFVTEDYVRKHKAEAAAKMEAARIVRDTAKTKTERNTGGDDFRFWQEKLTFFTGICTSAAFTK